jgi:very-short-patch-repair endonuclease
VYAVGRRELSQKGKFRAAVLAIGDGAVLSHFAAATHHGVWKGSTTPVDITVVRRVASRPGIRVHCVAQLPAHAITVVDGIPVTTVERAILDLAATMYSQRYFRRLVHESEAQGKTDPERLMLEIARARPGCPGVPRLLAEIADGPKPTRSGKEDDLVVILRAGRFPPFQTNARVPGTPRWVNVDVLFMEQSLVIELDAGPWHKTKFRRELDAYKQTIVEGAGYALLRLTDDDVAPQSEAQTVARIWNALA